MLVLLALIIGNMGGHQVPSHLTDVVGKVMTPLVGMPCVVADADRAGVERFHQLYKLLDLGHLIIGVQVLERKDDVLLLCFIYVFLINPLLQ